MYSSLTIVKIITGGRNTKLKKLLVWFWVGGLTLTCHLDKLWKFTSEAMEKTDQHFLELYGTINHPTWKDFRIRVFPWSATSLNIPTRNLDPTRNRGTPKNAIWNAKIFLLKPSPKNNEVDIRAQISFNKTVKEAKDKFKKHRRDKLLCVLMLVVYCQFSSSTWPKNLQIAPLRYLQQTMAD